MDDLIDQVACGDDAEKGKPDPELVLLALEKLDLASARTVMIGDTPYHTEAAMATGVASIGLLSGGFAREALLEAGALDVLEQIGVLKSLLTVSCVSFMRDVKRWGVPTIGRRQPSRASIRGCSVLLVCAAAVSMTSCTS
ncbi:HAD family hydrolase [Bradyrhizobium sp. Pear77]|nr:HAD family hydrolase [Bradyrhizobium altum]